MIGIREILVTSLSLQNPLTLQPKYEENLLFTLFLIKHKGMKEMNACVV